jgi:hypothetical protein
MVTIDSFDELTDFKDGEDDKYLVEYVLFDDGGFCHRASPFLMKKGAIFEHNYGTYKVVSINRKLKNIVVVCDRIDNETPDFDSLFKEKEKFN